MVSTALIAAALALAAPDSPPEGSGWTFVSLDLEIEPLPADDKLRLSGRAVVELDLDTSPGPTFGVNKRKAVMEFTAATGPEGSTLTLNRTIDEPDHIRILDVRLASPAKKGDRVTVDFTLESRRESMQFILSDVGAIASWVEGWYPFPMPRIDLGESASASHIGVVGTTRFKLPKGWRAMTCGKRAERTETESATTETWTVEKPVARSFVAGGFHETSEKCGRLDVALYTLEAPKPTARRQVETLGAALEAMEKRFGPYPYDGYAIVEIPGWISPTNGWGASSEQGFIMAISEFLEVESGNLPLFAHEAAHGWWGNLVNTKGPGSILCSEALAQYGAVIAIETIEGPEAAAEFLRFSRKGYVDEQCARGYFDIVRRGEDIPLAKLSSGGVSHTLSDAKGHWFFHMLRGRVGDDVFFATLRDLIARFGGKTLSLDELRDAFIAAAPGARLERFFGDWLDRAGAPVLEAEWVARDGGGGEIVIRQAHEGEPYDLSVEIAIESETSGRRLVTVETAAREARVRVDGVGGAPTLSIDPAHKILVWKPEYGPRPAAIDKPE